MTPPGLYVRCVRFHPYSIVCVRDEAVAGPFASVHQAREVAQYLNSTATDRTRYYVAYQGECRP